jgi:hypothetical protein
MIRADVVEAVLLQSQGLMDFKQQTNGFHR